MKGYCVMPGHLDLRVPSCKICQIILAHETELRRLAVAGWRRAQKETKLGVQIPYTDSNAAGYVVQGVPAAEALRRLDRIRKTIVEMHNSETGEDEATGPQQAKCAPRLSVVPTKEGAGQ